MPVVALAIPETRSVPAAVKALPDLDGAKAAGPAQQALPRSTAGLRIARDSQKKAILTREEEAELVRRWREEGDQGAFTELICAHMRMVPSAAKALTSKGWKTNVPMKELCQSGFEGLLYAAQHFDHKLGYRFSTYVRWSIVQAIRETMTRSRSVVRLPRRAITNGLFFTVKEIEEKVRIAHPDMSEEEVVEEIARVAKVSAMDVQITQVQVKQGDVALDASPEVSRRIEFLSVSHVTPEDELSRNQVRRHTSELLRAEIEKLPDIQQAVLEARFWGFEPSADSIIEEYGIDQREYDARMGGLLYVMIDYLHLLSARQRSLLDLRFFQSDGEKTLGEVAELMDLTVCEVRALQRKAFRTLRDAAVADKALTIQQLALLEARFLMSREPTLKELGRQLGRSAERIRQIQVTAIDTLRRRLPRNLLRELVESAT